MPTTPSPCLPLSPCRSFSLSPPFLPLARLNATIRSNPPIHLNSASLVANGVWRGDHWSVVWAFRGLGSPVLVKSVRQRDARKLRTVDSVTSMVD